MKPSIFLPLCRLARLQLSIATLLLLFAPGVQAQPNVIFILADDLGYGDLGCYGQQRLQTPRIDRLAAEGVRFTQHYSGSTVCAPSRCVLMTGKHSGHCHIRGNARYDLPSTELTVAEVAKCGGYVTAMFGKWGLGGEGSVGTPLKQGFDHFFGYLDQLHAHNYYPTFLYRGEARVSLPNVVPQEGKWGQGVASVRKAYSHDLFIDEALRFIKDHSKQRFFLYLPLTLPHANNEARRKGMEVPEWAPFDDVTWPEPERGFAGMVHRLDRDVGRIVDGVDALGIAGNTLIIFTSDNGPHSEGGHKANAFDSNGALRGIKRDLTEGGIRVPFVARWRGSIAPARVSDHVSYFGDFLATMAECAGIELAVDHDGISYLPALLDKPQRQHPFLYWEFYERGAAQAVRKGHWKGVRKGIGSREHSLALFDLRSDVGEAHDVAGEHEEVVSELEGILEREHRTSPLWRLRKRPSKTQEGKSRKQ